MPVILFLTAALLLLGSPGPGIAALVSIGRAEGFVRGLRFLSGLLAGLAVSAALSAAGLVSLVLSVPAAAKILAVAATAYLAWLAFKVATAPIAEADAPKPAASTVLGGLLLGLTNPKAYVAFVALMASYPVVPGDHSADMAAKWALILAVILAVDMAWLYVGSVAGRARLKPRTERAINVAMGATILATALYALT